MNIKTSSIFVTTLILVFLLFYTCSNDKIECSYQVYEKYEILLNGEISDISLNDYQCDRRITLTDISENSVVEFELPISFNCFFYIRKIVFGDIEYLYFFNTDTPEYVTISLKDMTVVSMKNMETVCNCNTRKCNDDNECMKMECFSE